MNIRLTALAATAAGFSAMAAPASAITLESQLDGYRSMVEKTRADCRWIDNKWTYRRGDKVVVCQPDRPRGKGWAWHREGNRFGWWNRDRRAWHFNAW